MGRKAIIILLFALLFIGGCEKKTNRSFYKGYILSKLQINNQDYTDSLLYYYPDIWVIFGDKFDDGTLEISFYQDFCPGWDCPTIYRYFYLQPIDKKIFKLKAPLWVRNTNRDSNGWYVCDTCSYLKSLYGYEWGIEWDNPETIRFHAIAKDTFLLEITTNK